jgi:hypothetical protein
MNFIDPEKFSSLEEFLEEYGDLKDHMQVEKLQKVPAVRRVSSRCDRWLITVIRSWHRTCSGG